MKNIFILVCVIAFLSGCASNMPKEVDIPVDTNMHSIKIPPKPELPISKLKNNSKPNDVIKAYAASVKVLEGYSNQLLEILNAINKQ